MAEKNPPVTQEDALEYIRLVSLGVPKTDAGKMVGRAAPILSKFCNDDPDLKAALQQAWWESAEHLIEEARRRAVEGWREPIVQGGKHVLDKDGNPMYKTLYDSNLTMFLIKERRPEYRESANPEINVNIGMKFEDRSAAIGEMVRVLEQAGIETATIGSGAAFKELPGPEVVLAEPSDVLPETSSVPRPPES